MHVFVRSRTPIQSIGLSVTKPRTVAGLLACAAILAALSGCDRPADSKSSAGKSTAPAANAPSSAPASASETEAMKALLEEKSGVRRSGPGGAAAPGELPQGHPPVGGAPPAPAPAAGQLPQGHPPVGNAAPRPGPAPSATDLKYAAPADWVSRPTRGAMRRGEFALPKADGDAEDAELLVFYFGQGEGGTVQANLDRWRGQLTGTDGQPLPENAGEVQKLTAGTLQVTVLDVSGRYAPGPMAGAPPPAPKDNYRMLAAVVETRRGPWFFKLTGPKATIEKHRAAYMEMLSKVTE